jgi:zinc transport system substrate-binding protein
MINSITRAFVEKDPEGKSLYEKRAQEYNEKLANLDQEYRLALADCKTKEIIYAGHYTFGYLAKRYGLKYLAAQGISPDSEPTVNDLVNLINQIKKDNIKYIFYEEFASPKIAETLADETQTKALLLNSAHNISKVDLEKRTSFITIFINNLANLKVGLQCQ